MGWYRDLSRREFIKTAAAAALLTGGTACTSSRSPWRFLRVNEARTLAAMCDCIIPPDSDPGADWAQVVNYIDTQLCGPFFELRDRYRGGIAQIEAACKAQHGKSFAEISSTQQTTMLTNMEQRKLSFPTWSAQDASAFFEMVLDHTMQGYYGDPRHGGNRERASWKMLGLSYPQVRGRFRPDVKA